MDEGQDAVRAELEEARRLISELQEEFARLTKSGTPESKKSGAFFGTIAVPPWPLDRIFLRQKVGASINKYGTPKQKLSVSQSQCCFLVILYH